MRKILARLRSGSNSQQGIRQSTALTTVYLLEMNRKFESFMRDKVEELEGRVAAQQARLSTKTEVVEEAWEDTGIVEETAPADELDWSEVVPILDESPQPAPALAVTEMTASSDRDAPDINMPAPPAAIPDYLTLLLGEPARPEPEVTAVPDLAQDEEEAFEDDAANNMEDTPEFESAREAETVDQLDGEADVTGVTAEEFPIATEQPVHEGISVLELFAETVEETIPWFDEEPGDFEPIASDTVDPAEGQKGQWG